MPVSPSVMDCCCSFWKTKVLCSAVASKSASVLMIRTSCDEKAFSSRLSTFSTPSNDSP